MPISSRVVGLLGSKALYFSTATAKPTSFASPSLSASMPYQLKPLLFFLLGLLCGWLKGRWWDQKTSPPQNVIVSRGAGDIRLSARGRLHRVWGRRFVLGLRRPHRLPVSIINCRTPQWVPLCFSLPTLAEQTALKASAAPRKGHSSEIPLFKTMNCCMSFEILISFELPGSTWWRACEAFAHFKTSLSTDWWSNAGHAHSFCWWQSGSVYIAQSATELLALSFAL